MSDSAEKRIERLKKKIKTETAKFERPFLMISKTSVTTEEESKSGTKEEGEVPKPLGSMSFPFKQQEYHTVREVLVPLCGSDCNNCKFRTGLEAMLYIRDHCARYGLKFKRTTAIKYACLCQVYDQARSGYVCMDHLSHTVLNRLFTKVSKLASTRVLKYI